MPDGMIENDYFPTPIITPTTKAYEGHDEDISREAMEQGIVRNLTTFNWKNTPVFFKEEMKLPNHMICLVDTKYEFGKNSKGKLY